MRFLIDMPLSPRMAEFLEELGHNAVHASDLCMSQAPDREIIERARHEGRIVITADLDFPQLLALSGTAKPGVVLFRGGTYSESETRDIIECLLQSDYVCSLDRAITVVERDRIRVTMLPIQRGG